MKKTFLVLSFLSGVLAAPAYSADCNLPKGEVDYLDSRISEATPDGAKTVNPQINPSADCKSVRIWLIPGQDPTKPSPVPTDAECKKYSASNESALGGGAGFGFFCVDFKVYKDHVDALNKPFPKAFVRDGALVTKFLLKDSRTASAFYLLNNPGDKVIGSRQTYLGGEIPGMGLPKHARSDGNAGKQSQPDGQTAQSKAKTAAGAAEALPAVPAE